jgi:predicted ATPase/DNA-binding SARP family transcriptional activator
MRYAVLGPIQLVTPAGPLRPPGDKQRLLLALLICHAPRVVSSDRLLDAVWGAAQPAHPEAALRTQLSRLRTLLRQCGVGPDAVVSEAHGYRLTAVAAEIDAGHCEMLVRAAADESGAAERLALLDEALSLWRGEAYEEFADLHAFQGEIVRLAELRVRAGGQRVECLLELGRSGDAVAAAERLVAADPLRERSRALLMQSLYDAGRQADALSAFQDYRRLLAAELGLDPSPELRQLETALLRHERGAPPRRAGAGETTGAGEVRSDRVQEDAGGVSGAALSGGPPKPLTRIIGRQDELRRLGRLLASTRLLTLTGAGGSGKTRLALEVRRALGADDERAVAWVGLDGLARDGDVAAYVAAALGVQDTPSEPITASLLRSLRTRRLLLVLDNCEHVVASCAGLVQQLLAACPSITIVATSREPLAIAGEVTFPVPPLATPPDADLVVAALGGYPAVELFMERAQAAAPEFQLDDTTAPAIARICRAVDGIPLGLELAAARLRTLPLDRIVDRLGERAALRGANRSAVPRHRTLRAAIEWSYELLTTPERDAFAQLSLFAGGFALEAAEAVVRVAAGPAVIELVASLVDKSLVAFESDGLGGRYRLLETIREFAGAKLGAGEPCAEARRRHAAYFAALAEEAEPHLLGAGRRAWLARLIVEQDNLRSALQWALSDPAASALNARLAAALWWFAHARGQVAEARAWMDAALRLPGATDDAAVHGRLLYGAAMAAWGAGELTAATRVASDALAVARAHGEPGLLARALGISAWLLREHGDLDAAVRVADEAADTARRAQLPPAALGFALWTQGSTLQTAGLNERARSVQEEAASIWRREGVYWGLSQVLHGLAVLALTEGRLDDAVRLCGEAIAALSENADAYWSCRVLEGLAAVLARQGRGERAATLLGAAEALREPIGTPILVFETPRYEQTLALLRELLEPGALDAAWRRGRALTLELALQLGADSTLTASRRAGDDALDARRPGPVPNA